MGLFDFIGNILGTPSSEYNPQNPNIQQPMTAADIQAQQLQAQQALAQQQAFTNALATGQGLQGGAANLQNVYSQLGNVAAGQGPNPALAQLQQATGQNVANQAALMASQRGVGANPGMIARQAAQQGANIQQQAAGQAATLNAQQQLGALGQMGGIAGQQAGMQGQAVQGLTGARQAQQGLGQQMLGAQNQANVQNASINNQIAAQRAGQGAQVIGGLVGGLGSAAMMMAEGGAVPHHGISHLLNYAKGGKVEAYVSPGEIYLSPKEAQKVVDGKKDPMKGEKIPGKAKVPGAKNSYANDTVHKRLSAGGVILPRSVTQAADPEKAAHAFVSALLAKGQLKKGK